MTRTATAPAGAGQLPAGLRRRLAAMAYDGLLLIGPLALYGYLAVLLHGGTAIDPNTPWFSLGVWLVPGLFFTWFWTHGGQTLGMTAWKIRLQTAAGGPISLPRATLRYTVATLTLLPFGIGLWWAVLDAERRSLHDIICRTRIVRLPERRAAENRHGPGA